MSTILVLDDEKSVQALFSQFLQGEGYNVLCAANGREGLEMLRKSKVDLVITDIMMPEMDGLEVVRKIRDGNASLPVIAISGGMRNAAVNFVSVAREFGANAIFEKPVSLGDLLTSVKELLG